MNVDVKSEGSEGSVDNADSASKIDQAIAIAKAKKAAKVAGTPLDRESLAREVKRAKVVAVVKSKPTEEERAKVLADREVVRAAKRADREQLRAKKLELRAADKKAPHMSKVEKAGARLPALEDAAQRMFNDVTANCTQAQVAALAVHLQFFNRTQATTRALTQKVAIGDTVTIMGGDPRFIGLTGTVSRSQRIRCYVTVEGVNKEIYLFTSDVEVQAAQPELLAQVG